MHDLFKVSQVHDRLKNNNTMIINTPVELYDTTGNFWGQEVYKHCKCKSYLPYICHKSQLSILVPITLL